MESFNVTNLELNFKPKESLQDARKRYLSTAGRKDSEDDFKITQEFQRLLQEGMDEPTEEPKTATLEPLQKDIVYKYMQVDEQEEDKLGETAIAYQKLEEVYLEKVKVTNPTTKPNGKTYYTIQGYDLNGFFSDK